MFLSENHKWKPFDKFIWLATPTVHPCGEGTGYEELNFIKEAFDTNWLSTEGDNITCSEALIAEKVGVKYVVGLSSGTAALHLAMKLAGVRKGTLCACSDLTFDATVNPVVYENGIPIFIDTEYETWNMDPIALEKAVEIYPEIRCVVIAHLYGTPGKIDEIKRVCEKHGAVMIEDAAESLGAVYKGNCTNGEWRQTGSFGDIGCISCNGNKIITGSSGGFLLTNDQEAYYRVKKWSTQSREKAPWYQHEELGYNYRMSNLVAGMIRGQIPHLQEHMDQKRAVWERYRDGFRGLPVSMNPIDFEKSNPNYWLSSMILHENAMCRQVRSEKEALYIPEHGKSCPTEILETLEKYNIQGRPIWKPMHMQPMYWGNAFITREGDGRAKTNAYLDGGTVGKDKTLLDVGRDIFHRGLCLPSDNKMTEEEQNQIIEIIRACFE